MSTYTSLTYHVIFSTKYRTPSIDAALKGELYPYIGGIIRGEKGQLLEIGGTNDHVHILAGFHPTVAVSFMLQHIKGNSSKWVNDQKMARKPIRVASRLRCLHRKSIPGANRQAVHTAAGRAPQEAEFQGRIPGFLETA